MLLDEEAVERAEVRRPAAVRVKSTIGVRGSSSIDRPESIGSGTGE